MKQSYNDHLLSLIWLIFLVFPNNFIFYLIVPICYILLYDKNKKIDKISFSFIIIISLLFFTTFIVNLNETYLDFNSIARVIVLILMFFSFSRLKGSKILSPYIIIAVLFLVISQFSGIVNFTIINRFLDSYYVLEGESVIDLNSSFQMERYGSKRLGGIYFNSNNYASYLQLVMAVLLCEIKQFKKKYLFLLFPTIVFSIFATGSRTSFIVLVVMIVYYLFTSKSLTRVKASIFTFIIFILSILISLTVNVTNFRVLKVEEGFDDSLGVKFRILNEYLSSNPPIIKLLFGNLSGAAMLKYTGITFVGTDFEIGNLIVYFGFIFFTIIFAFYFWIYRNILPKYRVIFTVLLWMFSNSILLSYRMAAVWMLVLSLYFYRSISEKKLNLLHKNVD